MENLSKLEKILGFHVEENVLEYVLNLLSEEKRRIVTTRFGFYTGNYIEKYNELGKILGIEITKKQFYKIVEELKKMISKYFTIQKVFTEISSEFYVQYGYANLIIQVKDDNDSFTKLDYDKAKRYIDKVIEQLLDKREQRLIKDLFGLDTGKGISQEQEGKNLSLTQGRICQIYTKMMKKLSKNINFDISVKENCSQKMLLRNLIKIRNFLSTEIEEEEIIEILSLISQQSRDILTVRWGIYEGEYGVELNKLNIVLGGIDDIKKRYELAVKEFKRTMLKYFLIRNIFDNVDKISFEVQYRYAKFVVFITDRKSNLHLDYMTTKKNIDKILETQLNEKRRSIIRLSRGLDDGNPVTLKKLSETYSTTEASIVKNAKNALNSLKKESNVYLILNGVYPEIYLMEDLHLNTRTFNTLKRSGIITIEDFLGKTEEEIKNIPYLGEKGINEVKEKIKLIQQR